MTERLFGNLQNDCSVVNRTFALARRSKRHSRPQEHYMIRTTLRFSAALAAAAVLAACGHLGIGTTNVADIKANPRAFEGKEVVIKGTVRDVTKLPMVDLKSYVVADATGDITGTTKKIGRAH